LVVRAVDNRLGSTATPITSTSDIESSAPITATASARQATGRQAAHTGSGKRRARQASRPQEGRTARRKRRATGHTGRLAPVCQPLPQSCVVAMRWQGRHLYTRRALRIPISGNLPISVISRWHFSHVGGDWASSCGRMMIAITRSAKAGTLGFLRGRGFRDGLHRQRCECASLTATVSATHGR
jgi:hypothetical protein